MRIAFLAAAAILAVSPAIASDKDDAMATVKKFDSSFNAGDSKAIFATCAPQSIIIDDFAPHVWQGATACQDWLKDLDAYNKKSGIGPGIVTLGTPWHVDVTGDRGYVVVPVTYSYRQNGKSVVESGSIWTLALQKQGASWRITGWAWAQH